MAKPSTALAKQEAPVYAITHGDTGAIVATIRENLGGEDLTPRDLDRIKVPSGGGSAFEIPSIDGTEPAKEFEGIVIHWKTTRGYWRDKDSTGTPPDCYSDDGTHGAGVPGGSCDGCFFNKFGSRGLDPHTATPEELRDAKGPKGCAEKRLLFVVRPGELLPMVVSFPATSIPDVKKLFLRLSSRSLSYSSVVMRFALREGKNAAGNKYSIIVPSVVRILEDDERLAIRAYSDAIRPALNRVRADTEAVD